MSILMMARTWSMKGLEASEKLVLLAIADFANDDGLAWPSISKLADKSSLSENTIRNKLRKFESIGLLKMVSRTDDNGRSTSYMFTLFPQGEGSTIEGGRVQPLKGEGSTIEPSYLNHHLTINKPSSSSKKPDATLFPADAPQNKPADPSKERHSWFVGWFCWAFAEITGEKYLFTKADAKLIRDMLSNNQLAILVERSSDWLLDEERFPRGSPTIKGLYSGWNRLAGKDGTAQARASGLLPPESIKLRDFTPWKEQKP